MTAVSPDARLPGLHAEAGDPHSRLARALADLEGAGWGLLCSGQAALAQQLAALLGPGTLRVDARLSVSREVFAAAGLALATPDADWRGARAVWLLEPDERAIKRAKRAEVPIIVDATLAPGGGWLERGAALIVYRDGATLSGFGDVSLSALFGHGEAPPRRAPAPSDLSLAMVLRDLATLPLRLARAARTTAALLERFGGAAQAAGPTALLLSPDSAADTHQPVGGVLAAAHNVGAGTLITPGVQGAEAVLALLRGDQPQERTDERPANPAPTDARTAERTPAAQPPLAEPAVPRREEPRPPSAEPEPEASLAYVPEIIFSDSMPQPGRREEVQAEEPPAVQEAPSEAPRREAEAHRDERRSERTGRQEGSRREAEQRDPPAETPAADQASPEPAQAAEVPAPSEPVSPEPAQPDIALTPDLPPAAGTDPTEGLSDEQRATYNRLRDWRNAEAKRQEISRFIIASNATLAEIARSAPSDETQLRKVRGMGPERVRKYGAAILGTVQAD
ncbi:hypothetical protein DKM44_01295 [Deinococcus irradiatisoli]|uniref:HRDC domain-containing protein n=1 Tax=Deinococcus irradiatisoli TaxID=2202254 RepID=A0A2Z3JGI2_9DEIO|nr:HRDC domain-containing protein [Deinococcus irradiatisoli]AWN22039.1 hypothetical protein DKM44_01295 [Deinococcus irradiatisoli]